MTLHVLYLTGHPAEAQLSAPIIRRMKEDPYFDVTVLNTFDVHEMEKPLLWETFDVCMSPCDRWEILTPTINAFLHNVIIVRVYAGINTSGGTHDDVIRRMLDAMGHVLLCESEEAKENLIRFGEEARRIHMVGITHLDDVQPDYSWCPNKPFAVFLMNPTTVSRERTISETLNATGDARSWIIGHMQEHGVVLCFPPNGDRYSEEISSQLQSLEKSMPEQYVTVYRKRMERNQFLGLLSKCDLFISNSSATVYEFPTLNSTGGVYNPSWRNAERTKPPRLEPGGSDRIINVLKSVNWSDKERLLRKRFRY